jgi:hypothetical protein
MTPEENLNETAEAVYELLGLLEDTEEGIAIDLFERVYGVPVIELIKLILRDGKPERIIAAMRKSNDQIKEYQARIDQPAWDIITNYLRDIDLDL